MGSPHWGELVAARPLPTAVCLQVAISGPKAGEALPDIGMQLLAGLLAGRGAGGDEAGQRDVRNRCCVLCGRSCWCCEAWEE